MRHNFKKISPVIFALILSLSSATLANASSNAENDNFIPLSQLQQNAGYVSTVDDGPQPRENLSFLQTITLKGLNPNYAYTEDHGIAGYEFPKMVMKAYTYLDSDGLYNLVEVGFGTYNYSTGGVYKKAYANMKLDDAAYLTPGQTLQSNETYHTYVKNKTGGVLSGRVKFWSLDRM